MYRLKAIRPWELAESKTPTEKVPARYEGDNKTSSRCAHGCSHLWLSSACQKSCLEKKNIMTSVTLRARCGVFCTYSRARDGASRNWPLTRRNEAPQLQERTHNDIVHVHAARTENTSHQTMAAKNTSTQSHERRGSIPSIHRLP